MNIAKIDRQYSWHVRGWCSDNKKGIFLSVDPFKEKNNQYQTLYPDHQRSILIEVLSLLSKIV